ncbi:MAG TPA: AAA family ATPase [Streptosporangiaceae bacterium]|nr:AAA family ATPase [Streptosporangiaceae bacterium]
MGRDEDIARVLKNLRAARLVTLTGPGGVGKTRLAAEAPGQLDAAAWFVPLAPVTDPAEVPSAVLGALGVREPVLAPRAAGPGRDPMERLAAALADRDDVLILDNCEHVIEAAAALAAHVLAACPRLRILATSRQPLRIDGETLCPVPPLPVPPGPQAQSAQAATVVASYGAARLFRDRAAAVRPDFELDEANATAVTRICRSLDGMPLAIELAAMWLRTLTPAQLAERLDDRFALLTGGSRRRCPGTGRSEPSWTGAGTCSRTTSGCWRAGWPCSRPGPRWPRPNGPARGTGCRRPPCCPGWSTSPSWGRRTARAARVT